MAREALGAASLLRDGAGQGKASVSSLDDVIRDTRSMCVRWLQCPHDAMAGADKHITGRPHVRRQVSMQAVPTFRSAKSASSPSGTVSVSRRMSSRIQVTMATAIATTQIAMAQPLFQSRNVESAFTMVGRVLRTLRLAPCHVHHVVRAWSATRGVAGCRAAHARISPLRFPCAPQRRSTSAVRSRPVPPQRRRPDAPARARACRRRARPERASAPLPQAHARHVRRARCGPLPSRCRCRC